MKQIKMYTELHKQLNKGTSSIQAIYNVLKSEGLEFLDDDEKANQHLYLKCDNIDFDDLHSIFWLIASLDLKAKIVSCSKKIEFDNETLSCNYPYLNIFK